MPTIPIASDDFNRANENPLAGNWELVSGGNLQLSGNAIKAVSVGVDLWRWKETANKFPQDHYSEIEVTAQSTFDYPGVGVRLTTGSGGSGYFVLYENDANRFQWTKLVNGTSTSLGTTIAATVVVGNKIRGEATANGSSCDLKVYVNGVLQGTRTDSASVLTGGQPGIIINYGNTNGTTLDNWSSGVILNHSISPTWTAEVKKVAWGKLSTADNSSIDTATYSWFHGMRPLIMKSVIAGSPISNPVVSTYSLVYTVANAYHGGILDPNGNIHFVPAYAARGQKIAIDGTVSTYSLIQTGNFAHIGGTLAPNGDIHFAPYNGTRGQKVAANGTVSTYSLVHTPSSGFTGGVLSSNGEIHFVPYAAARGQKVAANGTVSTYSLVYTSGSSYIGGVLAPNGDIHFVPNDATVGQKVAANGTVSTYSLAHTTSQAYFGGVLAPNGDIHFVPRAALVGQKISIKGVVSTYSLIYNAASPGIAVGLAYHGGVLAPNGDIHFIPYYATVGQKVDINGIVSTYSIIAVNEGFAGGILLPNGEIHNVPYQATVGRKMSILPAIPFNFALCSSPYFNKL